MKIHYCFFFLVSLFFSCEDEVISDIQIIGTWYQDAGKLDGNLSYRNTIDFKFDGTFEAILKVVESNNPKNTIGYLSLIKGEYEIEKNTLRRFNVEQYGLDNENQFLNLDQLVFEVSIANTPTVDLRLDKNKNSLTLINIDCRLRKSMCIPEQTYFKNN